MKIWRLKNRHKAAVAAVGQLLSSLIQQRWVLNRWCGISTSGEFAELIQFNTGKLHFSDYDLCTAPHGHSKDSCRMHRAWPRSSEVSLHLRAEEKKWRGTAFTPQWSVVRHWHAIAHRKWILSHSSSKAKAVTARGWHMYAREWRRDRKQLGRDADKRS